MLSKEFRTRLALSDEPHYLIATRAHVHPSTLSKLLHGAEPVRPDDPRVIRVGEQIGLSPTECFSEGESGSAGQIG